MFIKATKENLLDTVANSRFANLFKQKGEDASDATLRCYFALEKNASVSELIQLLRMYATANDLVERIEASDLPAEGEVEYEIHF